MSKYTDGHYDDGPEGRRRGSVEETSFMDDESEGAPARSSRSMPVPEHMHRRTDRQRDVTDGRETPPTYGEEMPPPSYDDAVRLADEPTTATATDEGGTGDLSPEEIAIVMKMQSDRGQYLPESRSSYAEAIEMIIPEENGEVADRPDDAVWQQEASMAPRERQESGRVAVSPPPPQQSAHYMERGRAPERRPDFECTSCWYLNGPITSLGRYLQRQSDIRLLLIGVAVLVVIGLLLFLGLFPASFVYIEYYQVALPQSKMTNSVDRDSVYYPGCYVLGPDTTLVRFTASAHTVTEEINVHTLDTIEIHIKYSLVYFIRPEEVGQLFSKFLHDYDEPFRLMVKSSVKNLAATSFTVDQFRFNRTFVEREMHNIVRRKLGGNCCPQCCPKGCQSNVYCSSCVVSGCDQGYHVDVRHFNLLSVSIPSDVFQLYLKYTLLEIEKEKEFFLQDHAIIEKETKLLTQRYLNEANEIQMQGTYEGEKVKKIAEAEKEKIVEQSYVSALKGFYMTLKVARQDFRSSLMMIRALEDNIGNLYTGYGYNESILFKH